MYRTMVVPLDGSPFAETVLAPAEELAVADAARLQLVGVSDGAVARAYLRDVAGRRRVPATVEVVPPRGETPGAAIARLATGQPDALLCMATHGRSGVRRAVLGSVTEEVVRAVDQPVLLTGPTHTGAERLVGGRMLVCLDGSERAEAIVPTATAWAKAFDMRLWLATVQPPVIDASVGEPNYLPRLARDLDALVPVVNWDTLHGTNPAAELVDLASRLRVAAVAMTTHGRTGFSRVALGSVATEVVQRSHCPVLVYRPT